jgi:outer membrane protein TolC
LFFLAIPSAVAAQEVSLDQALAAVEDSNEEWQIVAERIEQSRALRRETRAALLPQLRASGSTTYNGQQVEFGDRVVRRRVDWSAGGSASVTVFDPSVYPLVKQATKNVEVAELNGEWQRSTLRFEVEASFFELAAAQRDVEIAEKTVELRDAYVQRATALEASGVALPLDVARATAQKLEAEQAALEARATLGNRADALAVIMGREPSGELRAAAQATSATPPDKALDVPTARPDLEAERVSIDALNSLETSRWWSLAPRFDLQGDLRFGPPSFTAPDGVTWALTFSATWLLFDGGARYARIDGVQSQLREASLRLQLAERNADARMVEASRTWRTAYKAIGVADEQVEVARRAYEMTVARFESGLATSIEVTEASDQLFRAQSNSSRSRLNADLAAARARYLARVGAIP